MINLSVFDYDGGLGVLGPPDDDDSGGGYGGGGGVIFTGSGGSTGGSVSPVAPPAWMVGTFYGKDSLGVPAAIAVNSNGTATFYYNGTTAGFYNGSQLVFGSYGPASVEQTQTGLRTISPYGTTEYSRTAPAAVGSSGGGDSNTDGQAGGVVFTSGGSTTTTGGGTPATTGNAQQLPPTVAGIDTNVLLIGGAVLAAFLILK